VSREQRTWLMLLALLVIAIGIGIAAVQFGRLLAQA
jgi:hypothetical protein